MVVWKMLLLYSVLTEHVNDAPQCSGHNSPPASLVMTADPCHAAPELRCGQQLVILTSSIVTLSSIYTNTIT